MTGKNKNHYAIIMAGGMGTRFWPYSRINLPKQFLDILGIDKSLLQQTYDRFAKHFDTNNIYIVTNQSYLGLVHQQLPQVPEQCLLGEPSMKNTAACIAYATSRIQKHNTHAVCVVAPSDHLILDESRFMDQIYDAIQYAQKHNSLVTLGIKPSRPDTGYGYIQFNPEQHDNHQIYKVKTFTEKPTLEIARTFVESGEFLWNAGIFIWSVSAIRDAFKHHMPEMHALFKEASQSYFTPEEPAVIQAIYEQCRSVSIDYGVMEKADNVFVIPSDFGWSDLGTWTSLYENSEKDENQNVIKGKNVLVYDSENCMVNSNAGKNKLLVVKGVNNLIIVDTPDITLVCDKSMEQEVKQIVTDIKIKFEDKYS
ncbi:MAG: mannose-1-phosphate guanylyltransferase [Bacteroidia bacterium]|jgi:mannose-1-phosphate guanylyltransferase